MKWFKSNKTGLFIIALLLVVSYLIFDKFQTRFEIQEKYPVYEVGDAFEYGIDSLYNYIIIGYVKDNADQILYGVTNLFEDTAGLIYFNVGNTTPEELKRLQVRKVGDKEKEILYKMR